MKETEFLNVIKETLTNTSYIGDDCAYLDDFGMFVTHDTLIENEHFSLYTTTPFLLGRKAVAVNLSDLAAAMAVPKYITVSLSLPPDKDKEFVRELYRGINEICSEFNVKVIGGDITGSDKTVISVCAIGSKNSLFISKRCNAKQGDIVVSTGHFGSGACGYYALKNFLMLDDKILLSQTDPIPRVNEGLYLSNIVDRDIAMIDSSDGLADSLYRIASASRHSISLDYDSVPVENEVKKFAQDNEVDLKDFVLWGGEDYELVACVDKETFKLLDSSVFKPIGKVMNKDSNPCVFVKSKDFELKINEKMYSEKTYDHFDSRIYV
ncbi:thiamine-phosphate kinase [bacterium]|nr:thiamine-phosphate kinase [bacterium]